MTASLISSVALYVLQDGGEDSPGLSVYLKQCFNARRATETESDSTEPPERVGLLCFPDLDRLQSSLDPTLHAKEC